MNRYASEYLDIQILNNRRRLSNNTLFENLKTLKYKKIIETFLLILIV